MANDRIEVVRQVYAAFKAGDRDALAELIDPDVIWHGNESEDNPLFGDGTTHSLQAFFDKAFKYVEILKHVEITPEAILSDGNVVMSRQRDDVTRLDGTTRTWMFNVYYEFNARDQIKEVWEATTSDWKHFP